MTIAEVRRRLPVGTEFTAEFINPVGRAKFGEGQHTSRRRVTKQSAREMVSLFLDGPKEGKEIFLGWKNTKAREEDGSIIFTMTDTGSPQDFLKITI